jgi:hypothetical protein
MGQIVFQATLGGQTALVGQNTASSFSLNLPLANDTLVGKATTDTLTNKTIAFASNTFSGSLSVSNGGTGLSSLTAGYIPFGNGTSAFGSNSNLFWDNTNARLGIGTSSPSYQLDILNATTNPLLRVAYSGSFYSTINYLGQINVNSSGAFDYWQVQRNGTAQLTLDINGNLGLGVTPNASNLATIQSTYGLFTGNSQVNILQNAYYNSGFLFTGTGYATQYQQITGTHIWKVSSASGTAGNAVTFSESMRIDTSGNVGIGTTSISSKLDVRSGSTSINTLGIGSTLTTAYSATGYNGATARILITGGGASGAANGIEFTQGGSSELFFGQVQEAGGAGAFVWQGYNGSSYTERMRIDSSGNLLVGQTSASATNTDSFWYSKTGSYATVSHANGTGSGTAFIQFLYNATQIGSITQSGTTAVLYNVTSDQRLKTNIVDAPSGNIDSIKIRSFDWISDNTHQTYGMVAQELLEVAPYAVHQPVDTNEMMAVDYSKLVPMMIKEIQDLKAEVTQLKAKVGI